MTTAPTVARKPLRVRHQVPKTKRSLISPQDVVFDYPPTITALQNGFLNATTHNDDVEVTFLVPKDVSDFYDLFYLHVDGVLVSDPDGLNFTEGETATMIAPKGAFPTERDATNPYLVTVVITLSVNGKVTSRPLPVKVDITPPSGDYALSPINFEAIREGDVLTPLMLEDRNGVLTGQISGYLGLEDGDSIQAYMGIEKSGPPVIVDNSMTRAGKEIDLTFAHDVLDKASPSVLTSFSYTVTDPAGNDPATSPLRKIYINLADAPDDVAEPAVPAFDKDVGSKLIDEADARNTEGVEVEIPYYTNAQEGDRVVVKWGTTPVAPVELTALDIARNPMVTIALDYLTIYQESGNETNPHDVAVTYDIVRGGNLQMTSPPHDVKVDLTQAGGPDPEPETPWNENLPLPTAVGDSGVDNDISAEDAKLAITIRIPTKTVGATPVDAFIVDDLINIIWADNEVLKEYAVTPTDLLLPELSIQLDAGVIADLSGGSDVGVYYTASRLLFDTTTRNVSMSPTQKVAVASVADLPGKGSLVAGTYTLAKPPIKPTNDDILAYIMYFGGKPVEGEAYLPLKYFAFEIPAYKNMAEGDTVVVTVEGYVPLTLAHAEVDAKKKYTHTYESTVTARDVTFPFICKILNDVGDDFAAENVPPGSSQIKTFGARTSYVVTNSSGSVTSASIEIDYDMRTPDPTSL